MPHFVKYKTYFKYMSIDLKLFQSDKMQGKIWSCDPALYWPILLVSLTPNISDLFCWPPWPPISLTYFTGLRRLPAQSLGLHGPTQGLQLLDLTQQLRLLPVVMGFLQTNKRKSNHLSILKIYYPGLNFQAIINETHVCRRGHNFCFKVRKCKTFAKVVPCTCI